MTAAIQFTDGREYLPGPHWPKGRADDVFALDSGGNPMMFSDGLVAGLTGCCGATFTGTDTGIACRSCYMDDPSGSDTPWGELTLRVGIVHPEVAWAKAYTDEELRDRLQRRLNYWDSFSKMSSTKALITELLARSAQ